MPETPPGSPAGPRRRSHARSNHARILAAARAELSRDPDASLEAIARAAGVVRRTLYEHFPRREALVDALAAEASQSLRDAFTAARRPDAAPPEALARLILASWAVGDHYRVLISLARHRLGEDRLRAILAPARAESAAILERGQRDGAFARHLPAPVLARAAESVALAILDTPADAGWTDPAGEAAATAVLITAGVDPAAARATVEAIRADGAGAPEQAAGPAQAGAIAPGGRGGPG